MADEPIQDGTPPADANAPAATRPEYIPETIWDGEKNAPKIDLAATLTEYDGLKAANAERAAKIPANPDEYKFDLPQDFKLPDGFVWQADPKDPLVAAVKEYAVANKLTQDEVGGLVKLYAGQESARVKAQAEFAAEHTKLLGEKAADRRAAATAFIDGQFGKNDPKGAMLKTMLEFAPGVEAIEALAKKMNGINTRGTPGAGDPPNENAELSEQIGKQPMGRKLLDMANSAGK